MGLLCELRVVAQSKEYLEENKERSEEEGLCEVVQQGRSAAFDEFVGKDLWCPRTDLRHEEPNEDVLREVLLEVIT